MQQNSEWIILIIMFNIKRLGIAFFFRLRLFGFTQSFRIQLCPPPFWTIGGGGGGGGDFLVIKKVFLEGWSLFRFIRGDSMSENLPK